MGCNAHATLDNRRLVIMTLADNANNRKKEPPWGIRFMIKYCTVNKENG